MELVVVGLGEVVVVVVVVVADGEDSIDIATDGRKSRNVSNGKSGGSLPCIEGRLPSVVSRFLSPFPGSRSLLLLDEAKSQAK